jgi:hypothetical protein
MGWNQGYTIFEQTVIGAYNLGVLTKELLAVLMEPYRDSDIDSGGSCGLRSADGKGVEQIAVEAWGGTWPTSRPVKKEWNGREYTENAAEEEQFEAFEAVTEQFGWR